MPVTITPVDEVNTLIEASTMGKVLGATLILVSIITGCEQTPEEALYKALKQQYPQSTKLRSPPEAPTPDSNNNSVEQAEAERMSAEPIWDSHVLTTWLSLENGPAEAICIAFGDLSKARCIPADDEIPGVISSSTYIQAEWATPDNLCKKTGDVCQKTMAYVFAKYEDGYTTPEVWPLVTACDACAVAQCSNLVGQCDQANFCMASTDCPTGTDCLRGQCVGTGPLHFQLSWSAYSDMDLHVEAPSGEELYYANGSGSGGYLDHDDTYGGSNSIENIYFDDPDSGTYRVWLDLYSGDGGIYSLAAIKDGELVVDDVDRVSRDEPQSNKWRVSYP